MNILDSPQIRNAIEDDVVNNGLQLFILVAEETCDVIMYLLNWAENQMTLLHGAEKILPTVEFDGHSIYNQHLSRNLMIMSFYAKID